MRNLTTEQNLKNKLEKPLINWFIQIVYLSPVEKYKQTNKQTINDESLRDIKKSSKLVWRRSNKSCLAGEPNPVKPFKPITVKSSVTDFNEW